MVSLSKARATSGRSTGVSSSPYKVIEPPPPNSLSDLLYIASQAVKGMPPYYIRSIFGSVRDWAPPHRELSEYTIVNAWRPVRTARYLTDLAVPAWSHVPPDLVRTLLPLQVQTLLWRPSRCVRYPDPFDDDSSFPRERWFFVNGVVENQALAIMNTAMLSRLVYRPITLIHNATRSLVIDLVEAVIGKSFTPDPRLPDHRTMTEPAVKAALAIVNALCSPDADRVVVVAHSQGTIITANVLRAINKALCRFDQGHPTPTDADNLLDKVVLDALLAVTQGSPAPPVECVAELLKKLEVYTLATCADHMTHLVETQDNRRMPYLEHFANQYDLVARLGVLSPLNGNDPRIRIDGTVYQRTGRPSWGHLCNVHYLFAMGDYLAGKTADPYPESPGRSSHRTGQPFDRQPGKPRLYEYYQGGRPAPYID
ncbi:MAG: hypothetical protein MJE77_31175 [Proteobacteria bacterium]|nr:hypothetical protein [Pseudomonadota bacterium]